MSPLGRSTASRWISRTSVARTQLLQRRLSAIGSARVLARCDALLTCVHVFVCCYYVPASCLFARMPSVVAALPSPSQCKELEQPAPIQASLCRKGVFVIMCDNPCKVRGHTQTDGDNEMGAAPEARAARASELIGC